MRTVFVFLDKDIYIRDLLTGDYLRYLSSKYRTIVFLRKSTLLKNKDFLYSGPNVVYKVWEIQNPKFWDRFKSLRTFLIRQFDFLTVQKHKKSFIASTFKNRILVSVAGLFSHFFTADFITKLEMFFVSRSSLRLFSRYCQEYNPFLVLTATSGINNFEAEAIVLSKRLRIPTAAVNFNWDNLTSKVRGFRRADYLIVWNDEIKKVATEIHKYQSDKVFISGILRFDPYFRKNARLSSREEFLKSRGLNPRNKTLLFATTSEGVYPFQKELVSLLLRKRKEGRLFGSPNIFIRLHYKDKPERYKDFANESDLFIDEYRSTKLEDDILHLKASIIYSDVMINCASTLSLDACLLGEPIVNTAFPSSELIRYPSYKFDHYKPLVDEGAVRLASSEEQFLDFINMYLENPETDARNRKRVVERLIGFVDGLSFKRNADFLDEIIERGKIDF